MERDPTIRAVADAAQLLKQVAAHRLIVQSEYVELRELAHAAEQLIPELVTAIGRLRAGRSPKRADD